MSKKQETIKESLIVSNVAVLRDALKETQSVIVKCMDILNSIPGGVEYDGLIDDVAAGRCDLRGSKNAKQNGNLEQSMNMRIVHIADISNGQIGTHATKHLKI